MYLARFAFLALMAAATTLPAYASEKAWVTSERLNRRTCPATSCGIVGRLFYREGVQVLEKRDGWVRVTKYYDASCYNGQSEYVDAGMAFSEKVRLFDVSTDIRGDHQFEIIRVATFDQDEVVLQGFPSTAGQ